MATAISSLTDNFSTANTTIWSYGKGTSVTGGALDLAAAATWTVQAHTKAQYSFIGSSVFAKVTLGSTTDRTFLFDLRTELADSNNRFGVEISGGTKPVIFLYRFVAGVYASAAGTLYSPTNHAWLRLRESGGAGFLDGSPDGTTWTQLSSLSYSTLALSGCNLMFTSRQTNGTSTDTIASLNIAPAVTPPPPPPPPPNANVIAAYSDVNLVFARKTDLQPAALTPEFLTTTTLNGPGFAFNVSDTADVTLWDSTMKCVLARKDNISADETTYTWDYWLYLPTQQVVTSWNGGVLWEFHTPGVSSGHTVELDNTNRGPTNPSFRFGYQKAAGANYDYYWAPLVFDAWHHITINIRWSTGSDGFYTLTMDGKQYVSRTGATYYAADGGLPWLQFGFYSDIGSAQHPAVANAGNSQVTIAGITYTTGS